MSKPQRNEFNLGNEIKSKKMEKKIKKLSIK